MKHDNPAARLLAILERGRKLDKARNCRECWEELLGAKDKPEVLMVRLGRVMELPLRAIEALQEAYPEQGNTWSHWAGQITAAFMVQNLHAEWKSFNGNIDDNSMTYLRMSAALLNARRQASVLEAAEVARVREGVQSALDAALAAELPAALKLELSRYLKRILDALDEYQITGAVAVLEAAEASLGHASFDSEYKSFLQDHEIGQRVLDAIAAAANLVTISLGVPQLAVALTPLLR